MQEKINDESSNQSVNLTPRTAAALTRQGSWRRKLPQTLGIKNMNTKNISNLLLKVGGMLVIILSISDINRYISVFSQYTERSFLLFVTTVIVPNALPLMLGLFLFIKPERMTDKYIISSGKESDVLPSIAIVQIERICLTTLGFYLLFLSISDIVFHTSAFLQAKASVSGRSVTPRNSLIFTPDYIATIAELAFSLWLILGAKGIFCFLKHLRDANNK